MGSSNPSSSSYTHFHNVSIPSFNNFHSSQGIKREPFNCQNLCRRNCFFFFIFKNKRLPHFARLIQDFLSAVLIYMLIFQCSFFTFLFLFSSHGRHITSILCCFAIFVDANRKTGKEARAQLLSSFKEPFRSLGFIFHEIFAERTQKAGPKIKK